MELGAVFQVDKWLATVIETKDLSYLSFSETDLGGTGCGKAARPDLGERGGNKPLYPELFIVLLYINKYINMENLMYLLI